MKPSTFLEWAQSSLAKPVTPDKLKVAQLAWDAGYAAAMVFAAEKFPELLEKMTKGCSCGAYEFGKKWPHGHSINGCEEERSTR